MSDSVEDAATDDAASEDTADPNPNDKRDVSLRLDDVTKIFDDGGDGVVAVNDFSMEIYEEEFIVLVGPSGCGKTTTLRTVAGLEEPTKGRILIDGEDVAGQDPRERDIAMVFQSYALYPHKTVRENIGFPLEIRKYPADEVDERVVETAEMLGIEELLDRRPADLSGGQQQRVALGRAVIRSPKLFLFDEPLSNLDAKLRIEMRTELNKLHDSVGKTSVYVTHDQAEAMTLGDRVVVMKDGEMQQVATPEEVYAQPANRFVAGFIGEPPMNLFDASAGMTDDGVRVTAAGFDLTLPPSVADALQSWDGDYNDLELGIRPESFGDSALFEDPPADNRSFEARVMVVEPMGAHTDLAVRARGHEGDESAEFTARVSNDTDAVAGETVRLVVALDEVHLFDAVSGDNLLV
jgi:multiple sugar transport system ATP-binding protein